MRASGSTLPVSERDGAWRLPLVNWTLAEDAVQVWCVPLRRGDLDALHATLSADEQQRAGRFHFPQDREHFIAARGVLRTMLGRYLNLAPGELRFCYGPHGKPALAPELNAVQLRFNVSHSHDLALYAVARGRELGVDIEYMRGVDYLDIAQRFFSAHERDVLRGLPTPQHQAAFYACWTRKEAYIKARGAGLLMALDRFDVSLAPHEPAALLNTWDHPDDAAHWSLQALHPGENYAAALAVAGRDWRCEFRRWPD